MSPVSVAFLQGSYLIAIMTTRFPVADSSHVLTLVYWCGQWRSMHVCKKREMEIDNGYVVIYFLAPTIASLSAETRS